LQDLIEESRAVTCFLLLDDESACQDRKQYKAEQRDLSGI